MPRLRPAATFALGLLALTWAPEPARATAPDGAAWMAGSRGAPLVWLRWGGSLRLRGQTLGDASLGDLSAANKLSGVPASLSVRPANAGGPGGGDTLGVADLRLRLEPVLHVGSRAKLTAQVDAVGTMVLGSDPKDEADGVVGGMTLQSGQEPARSALGIRRLWATYDVLGLAEVLVGRAPDHFGLGLLRNDGRDDFADHQSDVDRVALSAEALGLRLLLARDVLVTLPVVPTSEAVDSTRLGLQDSADVIRWLVELRGGVADEEPEGFAWGGALLYQDQDVALQAEHAPDPAAAMGEGCVQSGGCVALVPRGASLVWTQLHLRWGAETRRGRLRAELEGALLFGTVDNSDVLANTDTSKTWLAGGAAARVSLTRPASRWLLDLGYASGEGEGGFGVLDQDNFRRLDLADQPHRSFMTGMRFHRGFLVDGLLFREIIGAVANTWYLRPAWRRRLVQIGAKGGVDLELGVMTALAARQGATPGKALLLGVEPEARLALKVGDHGTGRLDVSYLVPGAAFDAGKGGARAPNAWRIAAQWVLRF